MMLSTHFPQLTSAGEKVPILGVIIVALMTVKGYAAAMPALPLTEPQIDQLVA